MYLSRKRTTNVITYDLTCLRSVTLFPHFHFAQRGTITLILAKETKVQSTMDNGHSDLYPPLERIQRDAHVSSLEQYKEMYQRSIEDPAGFWDEISKQFFWKSPPTGEFLQYNFDCNQGPISIKWMDGAQTNICYNALDRNIDRGMGDKIAFYW